ncbi:hypothetical protein GCM10010964_24580 [Caldovatus sediminis]|uniref:Hydantoinase/oxoprolinase N-terminal domain-containing protein n=1 Tax=Caldovatus sediminis TaxID=2041189 RepID=A0A8J2ZCN1_9PROT|nr:hypothetical protein GCM10010964_24580 [Caldovatus sediminis]
MTWRIAADVGGTSTDLQILGARSGVVRAWRPPTTPDDPSAGLMSGLREAAERFGFARAEGGLLPHGAAIATNVVREHRLARDVLLDTAGFKEVPEINRHVRRDSHGLAPDPVPTLIPRDRRLGAAELVRADGRRGVRSTGRHPGAARPRGRSSRPRTGRRDRLDEEPAMAQPGPCGNRFRKGGRDATWTSAARWRW